MAPRKAGKRPKGCVTTFGVIADIQYADSDDGHNFQKTSLRMYRRSLDMLGVAVKSFEREKVNFIVQVKMP